MAAKTQGPAGGAQGQGDEKHVGRNRKEGRLGEGDQKQYGGRVPPVGQGEHPIVESPDDAQRPGQAPPGRTAGA